MKCETEDAKSLQRKSPHIPKPFFACFFLFRAICILLKVIWSTMARKHFWRFLALFRRQTKGLIWDGL